jgi:nitronate monooxygenase
LVLDALDTPIVLAPLAGGPATPELAAAVSNAGGLGFLGSGYLTADALARQLRRTRELTARPIGVNLFVISGGGAGPATYSAYVASLSAEADALGVAVGEPRFDDDEFAAKVEVLLADPVPVVSFTFGLPPSDVLERLRAAGSEIWVTVTNPDEAQQARRAGAEVLVVQGAEAGGHRGSFEDDDITPEPLVTLVEAVRATNDLPIVAAGGIAANVHARVALDAGANAVAAGTAFMLAPEAGTAPVLRDAIASQTPTALTRAFTGRLARGIRNRFMLEHAGAPSAYPEIHYATAPLRAAARAAGDPDVVNLWAGVRHSQAVARPAAETVRALAEGDAR